MRSRQLMTLALLLGAASCSVLRFGRPVAVSGPGLSAIAGEWRGSYESGETGRSGSILFTLSASGDSASGDVIMVPRTTGVALGPETMSGVSAPGPDRGSRVLTIRFVRAEGSQVRGALDPYEDPECRCTVLTTFAGRLEGDRIRGTFHTTGRPLGAGVTGTWSVRRTR